MLDVINCLLVWCKGRLVHLYTCIMLILLNEFIKKMSEQLGRPSRVCFQFIELSTLFWIVANIFWLKLIYIEFKRHLISLFFGIIIFITTVDFWCNVIITGPYEMLNNLTENAINSSISMVSLLSIWYQNMCNVASAFVNILCSKIKSWHNVNSLIFVVNLSMQDRLVSCPKGNRQCEVLQFCLLFWSFKIHITNRYR